MSHRRRKGMKGGLLKYPSGNSMVDKVITYGPGPNNEFMEACISYRSFIPDLKIPQPDNIIYDFSASIAGVLGEPESKWVYPLFGISRSVLMEILYELYDGALLYYASRNNKLDNAFTGHAADRMILKNLSVLPEMMVKYRYYLGVANPDGEYRLFTGKDEDLELIGIQDSYHRMFFLDTSETRKKLQSKYGRTSVRLIGSQELQILNDNGNSTNSLSFRKCLHKLMNDEKNPIRIFLDEIYTNVRIPEYHAVRIGDNIIFDIDKYVQYLIQIINYLFTNDLDLPYKPRNREPFRIRVFRVAGAKPIPPK